MDESLYIELLKTSIRDLLAAGRSRFGWRDIWNSRVVRAEQLLRKRPRRAKPKP